MKLESTALAAAVAFLAWRRSRGGSSFVFDFFGALAGGVAAFAATAAFVRALRSLADKSVSVSTAECAVRATSSEAGDEKSGSTTESDLACCASCDCSCREAEGASSSPSISLSTSLGETQGNLAGVPSEEAEVASEEAFSDLELENVLDGEEESRAGLPVFVNPRLLPRRRRAEEDATLDFCSDEETRRGTATSALHEEETFLPGRAKIFFKTFGCSHNVSDSEYMRGLLSASGYAFTEDLSEADVCVVNSCTVKSPSEFALYALVQRALYPHSSPQDLQRLVESDSGRKAKDAEAPSTFAVSDEEALSSLVAHSSTAPVTEKRRRRVPCVVAGCVPAKGTAEKRGEAHALLLSQCSIVGVNHIDRVVEAVEETLQGRRVRLTGKKRLPALDLPKIRRNRFIEIIPISTGCLGSCTYCKTKHARGTLVSYSEEAIVNRVSQAVEEGATQIWLTSEDTGAYGLDVGSNLVSLLRRVLSLPLPKEVMVRVGMGNPPFLLSQLDAAVELFRHPNIFEFLQLPVQSGSNAVLKRMRREYTAEDFCTVVDAFMRVYPHFSIMTDIICGFPGETEEDHQATLSLLQAYQFPAVNISQFYPRPGTVAASMKLLPSQVVKRRSREVTRLFESYACYDWLVGQTVQVWFSSLSDRSDHTVGHTKQYVKVLVERWAVLACELSISEEPAKSAAFNSFSAVNVTPGTKRFLDEYVGWK